MRRLLLIALLLFAAPAWADTLIFHEQCTSNPQAELSSSTAIAVGTSWSSKQALVGSTAQTLVSGGASSTQCGVSGGANNVGFGYTVSPAPSTDTYYAEFIWIDGGNATATHCQGMLLNYIDTSNYYACLICDDETTGAVKVVKVSGGSGSALSSTTQGTVPDTGTDILECKIDYTGANPTITFRNRTDALTWVNVTDSSSPLTETKSAGAMAGATPEATGDDAGAPLRLDEFKVSEVPAVGGRGRTLFVHSGGQ
jgi:hypothetical protein